MQQSFRELGVSSPVVDALAARSIHTPFRIQALVLKDANRSVTVPLAASAQGPMVRADQLRPIIPVTVSQGSHATITGNFVASAIPAYTLATTVSGLGTITSAPGGINCPGACSAGYAGGTVVTLTAAPTAGYTFSGWGGACGGTGSTCTVRMSAARSVSAVGVSPSALCGDHSGSPGAGALTRSRSFSTDTGE